MDRNKRSLFDFERNHNFWREQSTVRGLSSLVKPEETIFFLSDLLDGLDSFAEEKFYFEKRKDLIKFISMDD